MRASSWIIALVLAGCSGKDSSAGALQSFRSALNPPLPPPDTIPEMLDYAADLQVNLADMAKLPEGALYQDVLTGDSLADPAAPGDSVEIAFAGWLPSGIKVDSGLVGLRVGAGQVLGGLDAGVQGMKPGGRRKLVFPPGLAFGELGEGAVPPNAVVVYDLELRRIIR